MAALKLEEYIKQLQDPVPEFRDPEDVGDETDARLAPRLSGNDYHAAASEISALRRRAAALGDQEGKIVSRNNLYGSDNASVSEIDSDEEEASEEVEDEDEDGEDVADEEVGMLDDDNDDQAEDNEDSDMTSDDSEEEEQEEYEDGDEESRVSDEEIASAESEEDAIIQNTAVDEGEKAHAVVHQLDLWDRLMEARIQLQKVMSLVNRLPPPSPTLTPPPLPEAKGVLVDITCAINDVHRPPSSPTSPRKRKAESDLDIDDCAQQSQITLAEARNHTISFWDEKTRLASKRFKNFKSYQTPVVKQVELILSDRDRLLRRTQVLRDSDAPDVSEKPEEVFDDNDFYQRLLKNLIESKALQDASVSSSASQWLEVQRLKGKKKKKKDIDTRASKGRKLRYNVHSKVVNFMAPRDDSTWSADARNELFKNLFKMPSHSEQ